MSWCGLLLLVFRFGFAWWWFLALVWIVAGVVGFVGDFGDLPLGWWVSGFGLVSLCWFSGLDVGCYGVWFSCLVLDVLRCRFLPLLLGGVGCFRLVPGLLGFVG